MIIIDKTLQNNARKMNASQFKMKMITCLKFLLQITLYVCFFVFKRRQIDLVIVSKRCRFITSYNL